MNASSLLDSLAKDDFVILGDLASNSPEFAIACEEARANALVLHINDDSAKGSRFGGLEIEQDSLRDCLSSVRIPVGISIGDSRPLVREEWEICVALGFSFVIMLAHHMPTFVWKDERLTKIVSIGPGYILEQVKTISEFKEVSALVASLTPSQGHGLPLNLFDVATLRLITSLSRKPVLYPTQRRIRPEDIPILDEEGCHGVLVNGSIYAQNKEEFKEALTRFRSLCPEIIANQN
jgi:hypothetical protein